MIKGIKIKFIVLATISMVFLMTILVTIMNVVNYQAVISEADKVLDMLSQPDAVFENMPKKMDSPPPRFMGFVPKGMSPEVPYESRFFSILIQNNGTIKKSDFSRIVSIDEAMVDEYVKGALDKNKKTGFIQNFRYKMISDDDATHIFFLDCGRRLDSFKTFLWISILVGISGCILVFLVFIFAAGKIVAPIAESYEKQKRFISDAGHEIKTPLTIISANLDLLEMDYMENEEFNEIRQQANRLRSLTDDLVYLSKMEETDRRSAKETFNISEIVADTAKSFHIFAKNQKKEYRIQIEDGISFYGEKEAIRQLVSILLENAMKYSPEGGIITLEMKTSKKNLSLSVFNTTKECISGDSISHLFERFYRTDGSRNSELGGHGIGLSIAYAITKAHEGKISAKTQKGYDLTITVVLPWG